MSVEQLSAQVRALKKQGAMLAAERDEFTWIIAQVDDRLGDIVAKLVRESASLDAKESKAEIERLQKLKRLLLLKLRDYRLRIEKLEAGAGQAKPE